MDCTYEIEYYDMGNFVGKDTRDFYTAMTNLVSVMFRHHDKIIVNRIRGEEKKELLVIEWR